ncbi:hypothetical protein OFN62_41120, partial [Escherichia coli]|nr:hypothetical protein [Escherichia coli]
SLASATSRPVQLPGSVGADSDPNKVQARVVVPSDPEPPVPTAPVQMQDSQASAPRSIPLGGNSFAATAPQPALPSG